MYLKSIEVQGFKSFANKMIFKFDKGITGIVGPNGSGKSNVADAVRWVLGEQSAKQLRSSKMEDVIFSGTETRKPLGFAYVAITLDNSDHKLAVDFDEVTVARRVYRSGESEYLMNGSHCRLKDVQELFFDTGIGKEGYSIIGQGQIDKILSGKPEERRELFDEAAGIVKFKKRKQAAEKNLEAEKQNLCRVNDILTELEKQVGPLKRQEETARIYLKLRDELKICDVNLYLQEYTHIRSQLKELEEKQKIVTDDLADTSKAYEDIKIEYEKLEQQLELFDHQIEEKRSSVNDYRLKKEKLDGEVKVLHEQTNSLRTVIDNGKKRVDEIKNQIEEKNKELTDYMAQKAEIDAQIDCLDDAQTKADQALEDMNSHVAKIRAAIDGKNADLIEYLNEAAGVKAKIGRYDTMIDQINIRKSELNQRLIVLKSEENENSDSVMSFESALSDKMKEIRDFQEKQKNMTETAEKVSNQLGQTRRTLDLKQQEFHKINSKYLTLKNISERYDGYGSSIKKVMERKSDTPEIIGVVADIIHVQKKFETAIEIALGGSIQNIVTDNEQTAKQMIGYLKANKLGRATFLPLTSVRGKEGQINDAVLREEGVIGPAAELVSFDKTYNGLIQYLLGRIVIVDHIDHALNLARKYKHSLRIVTLEGDLLSPGGSMSGGAYKNSGNLLGRSREMTELNVQIEQIKKEITECNQQINTFQDKKAEIKKSSEKLQIRLQELSLEENTIRMNLNQAKQAAADSASVHRELEKEENALKQQIQEIQVTKDTLNASLKEYDKLQTDTQKLIEEFNERLKKAIDETKRFSDQTADIRLQASGYLQKNQFIVENIKRVRGDISKLNDEVKKIEEDTLSYRDEEEQKNAQVRACEDSALKMIQVIESDEQSLKSLRFQREEISVTHKSFFAKREEISERISALDKENFRLTSQIEKLDEQKTSRSNYMWEEYELTYNSAAPLRNEAMIEMGASALKKNINELKTRIRGLGHVNVNAIEEYRAVSERYELLKAQHDDLVEAEGKLSDIIESLDQAMRAQFTEKFKEIQVNFDKVFKELFGGGKGTLELTEGEDVLYAGIRIIASPPGKKLQNMMQMSGGEKALTAIALLFAIQSLKPSPFCLLDEIEAALDDANVKRYAQYLNKLTDDTQFIIITHRRGTMNAADVLYGITMQEKGVSTLVSVNLIDSKLDD